MIGFFICQFCFIFYMLYIFISSVPALLSFFALSELFSNVTFQFLQWLFVTSKIIPSDVCVQSLEPVNTLLYVARVKDTELRTLSWLSEWIQCNLRVPGSIPLVPSWGRKGRELLRLYAFSRSWKSRLSAECLLFVSPEHYEFVCILPGLQSQAGFLHLLPSHLQRLKFCLQQGTQRADHGKAEVEGSEVNDRSKVKSLFLSSSVNLFFDFLSVLQWHDETSVVNF